MKKEKKGQLSSSLGEYVATEDVASYLKHSIGTKGDVRELVRNNIVKIITHPDGIDVQMGYHTIGCGGRT